MGLRYAEKGGGAGRRDIDHGGGDRARDQRLRVKCRKERRGRRMVFRGWREKEKKTFGSF